MQKAFLSREGGRENGLGISVFLELMLSSPSYHFSLYNLDDMNSPIKSLFSH